MLAAQNLQTGEREIMVAGGMESMSNAPFYFPRGARKFIGLNLEYGHQLAKDAIIVDGLWDVYNQVFISLMFLDSHGILH